MKGFHKKIVFYISKEILYSFFVAFSFFVIIFILNQILYLAELLLSRKVPFFDVILILIFSLPSILAISAPNGALVGVLMTAGRLSTDNEILAFQSLGISLKKVFFPIFLLGIVFTLGSFFINDYLLPLGHINYSKLYRELIYSSPELELAPYSFKSYQNSVIITSGLKDGIYEHLIILDKTSDQKSRMIYSKNGMIDKSGKDKGIISLNLDNVISLTPERLRNDFEYQQAEKMNYNLVLNNITNAIQPPTPREMSSIDVFNEIQKKELAFQKRLEEWKQQVNQFQFELSSQYLGVSDQSKVGFNTASLLEKDVSPALDRYLAQKGRDITDRSIYTWQMEFYQKFSIPLACVMFVILAFPIGLYNKRSGKTMGFGVGVLISIIYYGLIIGSRTVGIQLQWSPFFAMFLPNFFILVIGGYFFVLRILK